MSEAFSIEAFEEFCRSKPAGKRYCYGDICGCALFQFLSANGYPVKSVGGTHWSDTTGKMHPIPGELLPTGGGDGALTAQPNTFSALASRLAALRETGNG